MDGMIAKVSVRSTQCKNLSIDNIDLHNSVTLDMEGRGLRSDVFED
jgi:hypothetical protein